MSVGDAFGQEIQDYSTAAIDAEGAEALELKPASTVSKRALSLRRSLSLSLALSLFPSAFAEPSIRVGKPQFIPNLPKCPKFPKSSDKLAIDR